MTTQDQQRIKFCAKVFRAFGMELTITGSNRKAFQVGRQSYTLDALERKAEYMLTHRERLRIR